MGPREPPCKPPNYALRMDPIGIGRSADDRELCKQSAKHQYVRRAFHRDARVTSVQGSPHWRVIRPRVQAGGTGNRAADGLKIDCDLFSFFKVRQTILRTLFSF